MHAASEVGATKTSTLVINEVVPSLGSGQLRNGIFGTKAPVQSMLNADLKKEFVLGDSVNKDFHGPSEDPPTVEKANSECLKTPEKMDDNKR